MPILASALTTLKSDIGYPSIKPTLYTQKLLRRIPLAGAGFPPSAFAVVTELPDPGC